MLYKNWLINNNNNVINEKLQQINRKNYELWLKESFLKLSSLWSLHFEDLNYGPRNGGMLFSGNKVWSFT